MPNPSSPLPLLLVERLLLDRSALTPDASLSDVVVAHAALLSGSHADVVGALAVPASKADELRASTDPEGVLAVSLVADEGLLALQEARHAIQDDVWITLDHVELTLPRGFSPAESTRALLDELAFTVPTYVGLPRTGFEAALDVLADDGVERAAYRCDGEDGARPTPGELAAFVHGAVDRKVPFAIPAGLEQAVRSSSANDAVHGLLNVLAAVAAATEDAPTTTLAELLESTDVDSLLSAIAAAPPRTVRAAFHGAGSSDPAATVGELDAVGVLPAA